MVHNLEQSLVADFATTFIPRWDTYSVQVADGSYRRVGRKRRNSNEFIPFQLTLNHVFRHLLGMLTLGCYMLAEDDTTTKMCLDADDPEEWGGLVTLASHLYLENIPTYLELSGRGGHLWFFFEKPLPGQDVRRFGKQLQTEFHLETTELFPKQDRLRTGPGSMVRLPFGIHRGHQHVYHFIQPAGDPLAPTRHEQIALLAHPARVPQQFLLEVLARAPEPLPAPSFKKRQSVTGDSPADRIKNAISVHDFISQYIQLDRGGMALCPFHDDHKQSLKVYDDSWYCFGCETGGSVIDFYMQWYKVDFKNAVAALTQMLL